MKKEIETKKEVVHYLSKQKEIVDVSTARLLRYNNKEGKARFIAELWENPFKITMYVEYDDEVKIEDLEQRLNCEDGLRHTLTCFYLKNDLIGAEHDLKEKRGKIWTRMYNFCKENEEKVFDEYGDYKKEAHEWIISKAHELCADIIGG